MDVPTDGQTDRQTDRQIDREMIDRRASLQYYIISYHITYIY